MVRNAARTSSTKAAGCSRAAKCPPVGSSFQWRMSVNRRSAQRREGRTISLGNVDAPIGTAVSPPRAALEALPVEPGRRRAGGRQPVVHDVVEQPVAGHRVLRVPVVVRPGPELLDDPGRLGRRRVDQAVAEGLRSSGLLGRVPGAPLLVVGRGRPAPPVRPRSARPASLPGRTETMLRWMPIIRSGCCMARAVVTAEPQSPPWAPKRS